VLKRRTEPPDRVVRSVSVCRGCVLKNWIDQGKLPALHIGRRVRIRRADFEALVEASLIGDPAPALPSIWDGEIPQPKMPGGG
jgi:excisionase family DNA binding protein